MCIAHTKDWRRKRKEKKRGETRGGDKVVRVFILFHSHTLHSIQTRLAPFSPSQILHRSLAETDHRRAIHGRAFTESNGYSNQRCISIELLTGPSMLCPWVLSCRIGPLPSGPWERACRSYKYSNHLMTSYEITYRTIADRSSGARFPNRTMDDLSIGARPNRTIDDRSIGDLLPNLNDDVISCV